MVINSNISALKILNIMNYRSNAMAKNMQRIATGRKINSAADDPSGYAISARMRIQISCLDRAAENAQRGLSMLKTAEGAMSSTLDILATIKERALHAADDTCSSEDRKIMQKEINQLLDQINDNANVTFNGKTLADGSMSKRIPDAVANVFVNEKLSTATAAATQLTDLLDRDGNSLDIKSSDMVKVSFVKNGQTFTTSFSANGASLQDIFDNANTLSGGAFGTVSAGSEIGKDASGVSIYTADGSSVISVGAGSAGVTNSISGISISISGADGNVKKNINEKLDAFSESIRAFDPSGDNSLHFQVGTKSNQSIIVNMSDMRAQALGLQGSDPVTGTLKNIDIMTRDNANAAIKVVDEAIKRVLDQQTTNGAAQSRLEYTIDNLTTASENLTAAESVISDANIAKEITEYTKNSILMQAAQAMLVQANQTAKGVLKLLQ